MLVLYMGIRNNPLRAWNLFNRQPSTIATKTYLYIHISKTLANICNMATNGHKQQQQATQK